MTIDQGQRKTSPRRGSPECETEKETDEEQRFGWANGDAKATKSNLLDERLGWKTTAGVDRKKRKRRKKITGAGVLRRRRVEIDWRAFQRSFY